MNEFSLPIVGIDFPNADRRGSNRRSELMMTLPGTPLDVRPEPTNRHDPHAVAVFAASGVQVGYLPAERAPYIAARLARGDEVRTIFQALTPTGAYARVRIGGGDPTLPPRPQTQPTPADDDFPSDPDGPEWGA